MNLPDLQMPKLLQMQVESLVTIAIGLSVNSKAAKVPKNYTGKDNDSFDVPMVSKIALLSFFLSFFLSYFLSFLF